MEKCYLCVFYSFCNKYVCFVICENYILSFIRFLKVDFLELQSTHVDFCGRILFSNATPFMFLCFVFFSTPYAITVFFFFVFLFFFFFDLKQYLSYSTIFYKIGKIFLTIYFRHFDFIEWFDLNSNSSNLFERSSISNFLVDFSVCFLIHSAM